MARGEAGVSVEGHRACSPGVGRHHPQPDPSAGPRGRPLHPQHQHQPWGPGGKLPRRLSAGWTAWWGDPGLPLRLQPGPEVGAPLGSCSQCSEACAAACLAGPGLASRTGYGPCEVPASPIPEREVKPPPCIYVEVRHRIQSWPAASEFGPRWTPSAVRGGRARRTRGHAGMCR